MKRTLDSQQDESSVKKARGAQGDDRFRKPATTVWVEIPPRISKYVSVGDEVPEDAGVRVQGETEPDEDDEAIPVRQLDEFSVFDRETRQFIDFSRLLLSETISSRTWIAAGIVRAHVEDDSDEEDEDEDEDEDDEDEDGRDEDDASNGSAGAQKFKLSALLECDAHYVSRGAGGYNLDPRIYLRTQFAWYILRSPSHAYQPFYRRSWNRHRMVHGILSTLIQDGHANTGEVLYAINNPPEEDDLTRLVFGNLATDVSESDLRSDDMVAYLMRVLDKLHSEHPSLHKRLVHTKVMQRLYPGLTARVPEPLAPRMQRRASGNPEKEVLKHRNATCVTPRVSAIAEKLFTQTLHVADMSEQPASRNETPSTSKARRVHRHAPASIEWADERTSTPGSDTAVEESQAPDNFHTAVRIDGVLYSVGDIVIVSPGEDADRTRAKNAQSQQARCPENRLADTKWFCKISYMFERRGTKYFHAQWLQHGCQTLLQEAAHPRALFWLKECDDLELGCIYAHCNVEPWTKGEVAPLWGQVHEENKFYVGLTWDNESCSLAEIPPEEIEQARSACDPWRPCIPCGLSVLEQGKNEWKASLDTVSRQGVDYHVHDFVYLHRPGQVVGLLDIAQIMGFICGDDGGVQAVRVQHYGRYDSLAAKGGDMEALDNRRLFQTQVFTRQDLVCISGKAYVANPPSPVEVEQYLKEDHHFYCDLQATTSRVDSLDDLERLPKSAIIQCSLCCLAFSQAILEEERLMKTYSPLKGLELFAGAGGLSTGLEMSGCVKTKWAIEFSPGAAKTFKHNHPHATVYNQCSNKLLEHAIQTSQGFACKPLKSLDITKPVDLPAMPQPGEVDFIYGGPPCQSFSLMNHHRKADDIRSTLVCNMISYVEFYKPKYFLLENVVGMLSYKVGGKQVGNKVVGGIRMGVVKFIISSLTALGYQVDFKVLQAGQHGAPQGRRRVIFLGALRGLPLPAFPLPQYAFPHVVQNVNLPTGEILHPQAHVGADGVEHQCAPLPCVTVQETINDLPKFDWIDPHQIKPATNADKQEVHNRSAAGIAQFNACRDKSAAPMAGYDSAVHYPNPPLSRYQMWIRQGDGDSVLYHYTSKYPPIVVERVVNVPIRVDAGHLDLPPKLKVHHAHDASGKPKSNYNTLYGRINKHGQFVTAMTTIDPNAKGGRVIHPDQKRILTFRECARAQGFPDKYHFLSVNANPRTCIQDQMRQIGNAVPVPLALALGKEIRKAVVKMWRYQKEQTLEAQMHSPEVDRLV